MFVFFWLSLLLPPDLSLLFFLLLFGGLKGDVGSPCPPVIVIQFLFCFWLQMQIAEHAASFGTGQRTSWLFALGLMMDTFGPREALCF